jgi:hypothetical protein
MRNTAPASNAATSRKSGARCRRRKLLEKSWSKAEILEAYLNLAPFRGELTGIDAAARGLFDKRPAGLSRRGGPDSGGADPLAQRQARRRRAPRLCVCRPKKKTAPG